MLGQYLKGNTKFMGEVSSWEDSIKIAAEPLLAKNFIKEKYIKSMIDNVHEYGAYIVLVPGIAMPHAKDEESVNKTGMSFLKLEKAVEYPEEKEVKIIFVLAAKDNSEHLELIADLSSILADEEVLTKFKNVESEKELIELIKTVEE
ncbi:PTS sugar transporter subunit IIA [Halanaerobium kushneri]|jgi:PTS system mannitol-specific IIA component/PTS system ascorbate-specific IIA component|uniref:Ascorbate-specific PTS system EIIA component n=1 Tax=Halanaerobium kushneri TaxID=56779 RepID=A0A1N6ZPG8_9FIRM|nr:PTS sugar transporter subunit IIA [Halanaerobium kushneri]KXS49755.1 MAG: phosphotransferase system mannitol/fructose-specifc IIA component (Ntr-type) [Halanaerobium sp. T82-1]PUU93858.1 MAG: phosphotransferase system mannitol/fructose-specifc IIA component (Ntr-type) [Halanaerobium sp.]SIR28729.1 PTS system, mannitol-specific IIA component/PTS system, ascorbate-specific IIA component [Halanaerobium kushneri]